MTSMSDLLPPLVPFRAAARHHHDRQPAGSRRHHDDTLHVLGMRTTAGTVSAIYQDDNAIIVDLDSGQGVPYRPEELDILGIELPEATQ